MSIYRFDETININLNSIEEFLQQSDRPHELLKVLGDLLVEEIRNTFEREGHLDEPWEKRDHEEKYDHPIGRDTEDLYNSYLEGNVFVEGSSVKVVSDVEYAEYFHEREDKNWSAIKVDENFAERLKEEIIKYIRNL